VLGGGRFGTDPAGFEAMLAHAAAWQDRVWAAGGCEGIGKHLVLRLPGAGSRSWMCRRSCRRGCGPAPPGRGARLTTPTPTPSPWPVRMTGLREVASDQALQVLRLLAGRRRRIGQDHTRIVCQLHQLLLELLPGGAKKDLSAAQARRLLAGVRPKDVAGKTRKRVALELVADLERLYRRKKEANKELIGLVKATGTGLLDLHGIGPSGAARLLVEVGDITRFPTKGHFASWTGTAPIDASSGDNVRHRLSRGGNRQASKALHMMAVVQLRNPTQGRAYYDRKVAAGKTPNEAMRCLKRRLSDLACKTMLDDLVASAGTGPGGHRGNVSDSSAAGSHPHTSSSDKSLPGPANRQPRTPLPAAS
jgi:transposase